MSGQYRRGRPRRTVRDNPDQHVGRPPTISDADIIDLLPATVVGLARQLGLHRSTVYERLRTLETEGFVRSDTATRTHLWQRSEGRRPPTPSQDQVDRWLAEHRKEEG